MATLVHQHAHSERLMITSAAAASGLNGKKPLADAHSLAITNHQCLLGPALDWLGLEPAETFVVVVVVVVVGFHL